MFIFAAVFIFTSLAVVQQQRRENAVSNAELCTISNGSKPNICKQRGKTEISALKFAGLT